MEVKEIIWSQLLEQKLNADSQKTQDNINTTGPDIIHTKTGGKALKITKKTLSTFHGHFLLKTPTNSAETIGQNANLFL